MSAALAMDFRHDTHMGNMDNMGRSKWNSRADGMCLDLMLVLQVLVRVGRSSRSCRPWGDM